MLLLELSQKQNGCPVECITHRTFISLPLRELQSLKGLAYDLLSLAKQLGPLACFKDTGKVRNQRVAKPQIGLILLPILILLIIFLVKKVYSTTARVW